MANSSYYILKVHEFLNKAQDQLDTKKRLRYLEQAEQAMNKAFDKALDEYMKERKKLNKEDKRIRDARNS